MIKENSFKCIYLTGAPATGKSSLSKELKKKINELIVFEYGKELTDYCSVKHGKVTQNFIREKSSELIKPEDVLYIDEQLLTLIKSNRKTSHILIDSHAVTKEEFGYRVTAFSFEKLKLFDPDLIVVLYSDSETIINRIKSESGGRPMISWFESDYHTFLQSSVAVTYSILLGRVVYFLDSNRPLNALAEDLYTIMKL